MLTPREALKRAIELCNNEDGKGGQTEFARRLNAIGEKQDPPLKPISDGQVWVWLNRDEKISEIWARHAEAAVGRKVTRYEFRPDVFGACADGARRRSRVAA